MNLKAMAVVASGVVASIASGDAIQWRVQDGGNGHWYSIRPAACWSVAQSAAQAEGGNLATLTSAGERQFVGALVPSTDNTFTVIVGGSRVPTSSMYTGWAWVTGEPFMYAAGEWMGGNPGCCAPNEFFLCVNRQGLLGDTAQCDTNRVVFEWSADCNNDGIVDYGQCRDGSLPDFNGNNLPDCCETGAPCTVGAYPVQWCMPDGGNGHWYQVEATASRVEWQSARTQALALGGDLASVSSTAELQRLFEFTVAASGAWIPFGNSWLGPWLGGSQAVEAAEPSGGWTWTDGTSIDLALIRADFNNSSGCGVNENRLHFWKASSAPILPSTSDYATSDFPERGSCEPRYPSMISFLIEWSADCNNDGVVDYGQILRGELADTNANGVPDICDPCVADIVQDGLVNGIDLAAVLNNWGTKGGVIDADVNNDGIVDGSDLSIVLNGWGACP